jgi:hypothetical protein
MRLMAFFVSTSLTKASSDYASEWTRDPGRGGFILIKAYPLLRLMAFFVSTSLTKASF